MKLFAVSIATTWLLASAAFAQNAPNASQNASQQPTTVNQLIEQQQAKPATPAQLISPSRAKAAAHGSMKSAHPGPGAAAAAAVAGTGGTGTGGTGTGGTGTTGTTGTH